MVANAPTPRHRYRRSIILFEAPSHNHPFMTSTQAARTRTHGPPHLSPLASFPESMEKMEDIRGLAEELIDEKEVLQLSRELIRIPSVSQHEHKASKHVHRVLDKWGLSPRFVPVEGYGPNVVSEIGQRNAPSVVLNGHIDTVEVMRGWKHDPFGAKVEKGMLYGLGSLDMKCGLAALMVAYRALAESGVPKGARVVLQAVTGEEDTGAGTRKLIAKGGFRKAKGVIVGEGFGALSGISIGRRGGSYFEIEVIGRAAHGAEPERGINAISDAAGIVQALDRMKMRWARDMTGDDFLPLREDQTVLKISGGSGTLSVPESCAVKIVRCTIPGAKHDVEAEIKAAIRRLRLKSRVKVGLLRNQKDLYRPFVTDLESDLVKTASKWLRVYGRGRPALVIGRSEADDNQIAHETGVPVVCFGPGELGELARYHQAEEAIHVDQLGPSAKAYFATALDLVR